MGGTGGSGGNGGTGGGGAGGTVKLFGTVLEAGSARVDTSGGGGGNVGGDGRLILGGNTNLTFSGSNLIAVGGAPNPGNVTGATTSSFLGPRGDNPFIADSPILSEDTPFIAGLAGGAELYGFLAGVTAANLDFNLNTPEIDAPPVDALVAVMRLDLGPSGDDYTGFDLVLFVNLTDMVLTAPELGVIVPGSSEAAFKTSLRTGGLAGPQTLTSINPGSVWATLVPDVAISINASIAGPTSSINGLSLIDNQVQYVTAVRPALSVEPRILGLDAIAVSPDGQQIYGVNQSQHTLVVINADGSQRQFFNDSVDGARDVVVSADGKHLYVASPDDARITIFSRDLLTGNLTLTPTDASIQNIHTMTLNAIGTRLWAGGEDGIATFSRNATTGALTQLGSAVKPGGFGSLSDLEASRDGSLLYAVSRANDALLVLNAGDLSLRQSLGGAIAGLDGAADLVVSGDDRFVYVTGQDGNTLSVFERNLTSNVLTLVQILQNGVDGVRGLAEPTDVALTPDGQFVLATGKVSNAVAVFQRDSLSGRLQFVQVLRNNVGGTTGMLAPSAIATNAGGTHTFVGSLGQPGIVGGLVMFDTNTVLPDPFTSRTEFDHIEALTIVTAAGDDTLTVRRAPAPQVTATTLNTGDGNDLVVLLDASASTVVNLGGGNDAAQLRSAAANVSVEVRGEAGDDTIEIERVGESARTEVFGGDDRDVVRVSGANLPASATTIAHGDDPNNVPQSEGDILVFDPQNPDPNTPNFSPAPPPDGQGSVAVTGKGTLQYDTFEGGVVVLAAPIVTFQNTPYVTSEGQGITLTVSVNALGSPLVGSPRWDLDGDGKFQDGEGFTLTLSWEQLVDFGLSDDGVFQIGVTAENQFGSAEAFTTLTINNTPPTITLTGNSSVVIGSPYTLNFSATDPGDDRIFEWRIDWGDGSPVEVFGSGATSAIHTYLEPGSVVIAVGAVDEDSAPGATFAVPPKSVNVIVTPAQVSAGGPYLIDEGGSLTVLASAVGTPAGFSWDINGDGIFGDATGQNPTVSWAQLQGLAANPIQDDGNFNNVRVQVTYSGQQGINQAVTSSAASLAVFNTSPAATLGNSGPVNEGSTATVSFANQFDPSAADIAAGFRYSYDFNNDGDFTDPGEIQNSALASVTVPALYLSDNGTRRVRAVIADKDGGQTELFTDITVLEVAPTLVLQGAAAVAEGADYILDLSAIDPGDDTISQWTVDWGDGVVEVFSGATQSLTHRYVDDSERLPGGAFRINVTAVDEDGVYTATKDVAVANVAPVLGALSATTVNEGGFSRLTGTISDQGIQDSFTLEVDWGDGSVETFAFRAGTTVFELTHQYLDDPSGAGSSDFTINATLTDDDGGTHAASTTVTVNNLAPTITDMALTFTSVGENGVVSLAGSYADPGTVDTHTVEIDWGDGTSSQATVDAATRTFTATHRYLDDDPSGTPSDDYTIKATVTDDDGLSGSATTTVTVNNVAPVLTSATFIAPEIGDAKETVPVVFEGSFIDAGTLDTYEATIDWGDGTVSAPAITKTGASGTFIDGHTYADGGIYTIILTLEDDDTGRDTFTQTAFITGAGIQNRELQIIGTAGADSLRLDRLADGRLLVEADFLPVDLNDSKNPDPVNPGRTRAFDLADFDSILILLGNGDDSVKVDGDLHKPVTLDSGAGLDSLTGPDRPASWLINVGEPHRLSWEDSGSAVSEVQFRNVESLVGGSEEDNFVFADGGSFAGTIDGGGGTNTLDYSLDTTGVVVDLGLGLASGTGGVANIRNVIGGSAGDQITGDDQANMLFGNGGDDILSGGGGNDKLFGGLGDDILSGGLGDDELFGESGEDILFGDEGADLLDGGADDDRLFGGKDGDILLAGEGNDILAGEGDDDIYIFEAGWGEDTILEGPDGGTDTLDFSAISTDLVVTVGSPGGLTVVAGLDIATYEGSNIERLIGGQSTNDTLIGGDRTNIWNLTDRNEGNLNGELFFTSIEHLTGGALDDEFFFIGQGEVTGVIDGGDHESEDVLDFIRSDFLLQAAINFQQVPLPIGDVLTPFVATGGIIRIEDIRVIVLAEVLPDGTLVLNMGPRAAERLAVNTEDGDEVFTVSHVSGDPNSEAGETVAVTAFGFTLQYSGVKRIFGEGGSGSDQVTIESGVLAPVRLWGDFGPSVPAGPVVHGDDILRIAGSGFTELYGGHGNDVYAFGQGWRSAVVFEGADEGTFDTLDFGGLNGGPGFSGVADDITAVVNGQLIVTSSAGSEVIHDGSHIENLIGGLSINDTLIGPDQDNVWTLAGPHSGDLNGTLFFASIEKLVGRTGEDRFVFEDGVEFSGKLDGGEGINTLDYSLYTTGVTVDLSVGKAHGTSGVANVQNVIGGSGDDDITGDDQDNILIGNAGDDRLSGLGGNDALFGGFGRDILRGGGGDDLLIGDREITIAPVVTIDASIRHVEELIYGPGNKKPVFRLVHKVEAELRGELLGEIVLQGEDDELYGEGGNDVLIGDHIVNITPVVNMTVDVEGHEGKGHHHKHHRKGDLIPAIGSVIRSITIIGGKDLLDGGAGKDFLLGDDVVRVAPAVAIEINAHGAGQKHWFDADNKENGNGAVLGAVIGTLTIQGAPDTLLGGAGNDTMVGDSSLIMAPSVTINVNLDVTRKEFYQGFRGHAHGVHGPMLGSLVGDLEGHGANDSMDGATGDDTLIGDHMLRLKGSLELALNGAPVDHLKWLYDNDDKENGYGKNLGQYFQSMVSVGQWAGRFVLNGGHDTLIGNEGHDILVGDHLLFDFDTRLPHTQTKRDPWNLQLNGGDDTLRGGAGHDILLGDSAELRLLDRLGRKLPFGSDTKRDGEEWDLKTREHQGGQDQLFGDDGDDILLGQGGDDTLRGGHGDDTLIGGGGKDFLDGGTGKNKLSHGNGHFERVSMEIHHRFNEWIRQPVVNGNPWTRNFLLDLADPDLDPTRDLVITIPMKDRKGERDD